VQRWVIGTVIRGRILHILGGISMCVVGGMIGLCVVIRVLAGGAGLGKSVCV
jgi:hypothetical protein